MFTWKPFYEELAQALLAYEKRQHELIAILRELKQENSRMIRLVDAPKPAETPLLTAIDPFTFFATFNRGLTPENRIKILTKLRERFKLVSNLPSDFDGVPVVDAQRSWFFPYPDQRRKDDVENLWKLAKQALTSRPEDLDANCFNRCLEIHTVGPAKLTMGLFWIRPHQYLALDEKNRAYFANAGVVTDVHDHASYVKLLQQVRDNLGKDFAQISHDAWHSQNQPLQARSEQPVADSARRYWLYAPGDQAKHWEECKAKSIMLLGFNGLGDLKPYKSQEEMQQTLKKVKEMEGEPSNDSRAAWEFVHALKPGDVVIAKRGRRDYLGYGIVEGPYQRDDSMPEYRNFRRVKWMKSGEWAEKIHPIVVKTLTDITKYPDYVKRLRELIGINDEKTAWVESDRLPARNLILYGPPGTGKTYRLRKHYMPEFTERKAQASLEERAEALVKDLAWWEVIAMALLDAKGHSASVAEILVHPLVEARLRLSTNKNPRAMLWSSLQSHTKIDCATVKYSSRIEPLIFWKDENSIWSIDASLAETEALALPEKLKEFRSPSSHHELEICRYAFTTFHQSFSYEDFIEGIKPQMENAGDGHLAYTIKDGVFKKIAQEAAANPGRNYALFIDEINRGNVAGIFGELITLIEEDKRLGRANELKAILPYSRQEFGVPANLFIIGTMNTADRSVEALDTALRRRFTFIEMRPDREQIGQPAGLDVDLRNLFEVINSRIEQLLDRDHCIGHAYFMEIETLSDLQRIFANKVIPLLREYFYGNPAKVGMVLGERFVKRKADRTTFADGTWGVDELDEREVYQFADVSRLSADDFASVYGQAGAGV